MHQVKPKVFCVTKIDLNAPQANILKRLAFNLIHILPRRRSSNIRQE